MKKNLRHFIGFIGMACALLSCDGDTIITDFPESRQLLISGFITDEYGKGISNASVQCSDIHVTSNDEGYFEMNVNGNAKLHFIKVDKPGYFTGARTLSLKNSATAFVRISLLEKKFQYSFLSQQGIRIYAGKVNLSFPAKAIADQFGKEYTGEVRLAVKYLDPSVEAISSTLPGDLSGMDGNGEIQGLASYAMVAVELQSPSGEKLNLLKGKEAELNLSIPQVLLSSAPSSIPLWCFDENSGLWKEEGQATKNGNFYEGKVSHFSFWNCDISLPLIHLQGKLLNLDGQPLSNAIVKLTIENTRLSRYGYSNTEGVYEGRVPRDKRFLVEILHPCGDLLDSFQIGPYLSDVIMDDVLVPTDYIHYLSVSGQILDANSKGLLFLPVQISLDHLNGVLKTLTNEKGEFQLNSIRLCGATEFMIKIFDNCNTLVFAKNYAVDEEKGNVGQIILTQGTFKTVKLSGFLFNKNNKPMSNALLKIVEGSNIFQVKTNQDGSFVAGIQDCNTDLVYLGVMDLCDRFNVLRQIDLQNITDEKLGVITVDKGIFETVKVAGIVLDCNSLPQSNVQVSIKSAELTFNLSTNSLGKYQTEIPFCDQQSITIVAYDAPSFTYSNPVVYRLPGPIQASPIRLCVGQSEEYLEVEFSDGTRISEQFNLEVEDNFGNYHIFTNKSSPWFEIKWEGLASAGILIDVSEINCTNANSYYVAKYYGNTTSRIYFTSVARAKYEFFEGSFDCTGINVIDVKTSKTVKSGLTARGTFKIKRGW